MSADALRVRTRAAVCAAFCVLPLVGCKGAQYVGSNAPPGGAGEGLFAPRAPTRSGQFETAVSSLREQVQLLSAAPGTVDEASARRVLGSVADAIASVPDAQGVDVSDAARTIRSDYVDVVGARGPSAARQLREALLDAAGAMNLLARGPYSREPAVARRVAVFESAAAAVDSDEAIQAQPQVVLHALSGAGAALASLERASGLAPSAVVPARSATTGAAQQQRAGAMERQPSGPATGASPYRTPFAAALVKYSAAVDRVAVTPPERVPASLRRALDALSDALQLLPGGAAVVAREDVAPIRSFASDMSAAPAQSRAQAAFTKRALDHAGMLLSLVARRSFRQTPAVGAEILSMRAQIAAVDAHRALGPQAIRVLGALESTEDVLRTMALSNPR